MRRLFFFVFAFCLSFIVNAQEFSRKDSLRGHLTSLRTCYDVTFYDLFLIIDINERAIERSHNTIHFTATEDFKKIQIDLAQNMELMVVEFEGEHLKFDEEFDVRFIHVERNMDKNNYSDHASERDIYHFKPNVTVQNKSSIESLRDVIKHMYTTNII